MEGDLEQFRGITFDIMSLMTPDTTATTVITPTQLTPTDQRMENTNNPSHGTPEGFLQHSISIVKKLSKSKKMFVSEQDKCGGEDSSTKKQPKTSVHSCGEEDKMTRKKSKTSWNLDQITRKLSNTKIEVTDEDRGRNGELSKKLSRSKLCDGDSEGKPRKSSKSKLTDQHGNNKQKLELDHHLKIAPSLSYGGEIAEGKRRKMKTSLFDTRLSVDNVTCLDFNPIKDKDERAIREIGMHRALSDVQDQNQKSYFLKKVNKLKEKLSRIMADPWKRRKGFEDLETRGIIVKRVFGSKVEYLSTENQVPRFLCESWGMLEGNLQWISTEHIYRQPGNVTEIQSVRLQIDAGNYEPLKNVNSVHKLCGLIKLFLRELEEPIFPWSIWQELAGNSEGTCEAVLETVSKLSKLRRNILTRLLEHLRQVLAHSQDNHMSTESLALVLGPCLSWPQKNAPAELMQIVRQQKEGLQVLLEKCTDVII